RGSPRGPGSGVQTRKRCVAARDDSVCRKWVSDSALRRQAGDGAGSCASGGQFERKPADRRPGGGLMRRSLFFLILIAGVLAGLASAQPAPAARSRKRLLVLAPERFHPAL